MYQRFRLPLIALALSLPMPALAQQAQDFSLPAAPTPTASPRVQGPVDEESGVVPVRPRVIRTATPTPTATATPTSAPAPVATQQPRPAVTNPASLPAATQRIQPPIQAERPSPSVQPTPFEQPPVPPRDFPQTRPESEASPIAVPQPSAGNVQATVPAEIAADKDDASDWTLWALLGGAAVLLAGAFAFWRRKQAHAPAPEIERPVVATQPTRTPVPPAADVLTIRCETEKLTRSAVFATLKYRLTLVNRTDSALNDVVIGVDLVSAHSGAPMEEQVATSATALEARHNLPRIAPRQNLSVEGQVQLPLAGAQVIFQGRHPLLVPLMRVRVDGAGEGALVKTFVVGQGVPDGGRVQPFRLDEAPRSYSPIAHRELA